MIKIGDKLPDIPLRKFNGTTIDAVHLNECIKGKKVVLFAVPGAFTPTCSNIHLPSFVSQAEILKAKGIEDIYCVAVNDPYVLDVWDRTTHAMGKVILLSDGDGAFTKAVGLDLAPSPALGLRSQRYIMVLEDGVVQQLFIEPSAGACTVTSADYLVNLL